jgi:cytochrome c oxidase cbb3-type subunit III
MKVRVNTFLSLITLVVLATSVGCHRRIGEPDDQDELQRPENVVSFDRLYKQNCSACHGENGSGGPAIDLSNPNYQALVDDATLRRWITSGIPGTQMPAFGESAGGFLTPKQIDALITGMRLRWAPSSVSKSAMPPYFSEASGYSDHGSEIFRTNCVSCHQQGRQKVTDVSYLALVNDQSLRTIVIAGRPDLGHPDWRRVRPNQPLADQDVSDMVAYLHSLRTDTPGQPYPETSVKR